MRSIQSLDVGRVFLHLEADSPASALRAVAKRLAAVTGVPANEIETALSERERLGSTSVGGGFAIPHCKLQRLERVVLAVAGFTGSFPFDAPDGGEVSFFFVVLSPPDQPALHLQILSQIARILKRDELRRELVTAPDAEVIVHLIRKAAEAEGL